MAKERPTEDLVIIFNPNMPNQSNVHLAFDKVIGTLSLVTVLDYYQESRKEYKELLSIILGWAAEYELKKDLSLINHVELLNVYNHLEELNDKYITIVNSELSDKAVIWFWNLMLLRKAQIEQKGDK